MAKPRSGLGRGLGALMGDDLPVNPQPAQEAAQPAPKPEPKPAPAPKPEPKPQPKPASKPQPAPVVEKAPEPVVEKPAPAERAAQKEAPKKAATRLSEPALNGMDTPDYISTPSSVDEIRKALKAEHGNVRTYVEEDDHVTIKGVVARERKTDNRVDINLVKPNPDQPRTHFKEEELEELADSIKKNGLLQPILVRKIKGTYQIIAGERRWQASKRAGVDKVPVNIIDADDDKVIELALIENIQRSDLNPIEEAYGYKRLMDRRGMTQADVALAVSKGRSTIANSLRLLELPEDAQQLLFEEQITAGHARAILAVPTLEGKQSLTDKIIKNKLSVREAENIARLLAGRKNENPPTRTPVPKEFKTVGKKLSKVLGTPVRVKSAKGKNKIEIEFSDQAQLEAIFEQIIEKKEN